MATAAFLIIGNEILSGRTQDANLRVLAVALAAVGIPLREVRVIPDEESLIVSAVRELKNSHDTLFTSGGIGPTHDDITAESIAKAFDVPLIMHPEAERLLRDYYGDQVTDTRLRMARVPEGATLIANPVSVAPGFQIENVYVMAGVPKIFSAMLDGVVATLKAGQPIVSRALSAFVPESVFAAALGELQKEYPDVDLGSYPQIYQGRIGTTLVARGTDVALLDGVMAKIRILMEQHTQEVIEGEFLP